MKSSLRKFYGLHHDFVFTVVEYLCHKWPRYVPHSSLITGLVTRLTRRVPLVEQKLNTLPMHMSSPPVFSEVRVTRSLVLCLSFVDRYLSCFPFSFGHCVVCPSSSYGFWLPHYYLQTRLIYTMQWIRPLTFLDWHRHLKKWHV